jgi:prepilin-type processing-associated H-X9-DG protein
MLLPALNKARDAAKRISCVNNLKQLGLCTTNYVQDYDGYLPFAKHETETNFSHYATPSAPAWYVLLAPYAGIKVNLEWSTGFYKLCENDASMPTGPVPPFTCPAYTSIVYPTTTPATYAPGLRIATRAPLVNNQWRGKLQMVKSPSEKAWLNEWTKVGGGAGAAAVINEGHIIIGDSNNNFGLRHNNGGNILFFDMHAKWNPYKDVRSLLSGTPRDMFLPY